MELFKTYNATTDWPSTVFYKELIKLNPNTKVILTVRNSEEWFESFYATLFAIYTLTNNYPSFSYYLDPHTVKTRNLMNVYCNDALSESDKNGTISVIQTPFIDSEEKYQSLKQQLVSDFERHNENVKKFMNETINTPDNLLVFDVNKDSIGKLCKFLNKSVPISYDGNEESILKRINTRDDFVKMVDLDQMRSKQKRIDILVGWLFVILATVVGYCLFVNIVFA